MVLDLRLGQRRLLHHRPHDRLGTAIELSGHGELHELGGDRRLRAVAHGHVGIVEIADHAEALELLRLDAHPVAREFPAFAAELDDRHGVLVLAFGAILLLDLPLDGQAVAVPAGHIIGIEAEHLVRAGDHVLQNLVQARCRYGCCRWHRAGRHGGCISRGPAPARAGAGRGRAPPSASGSPAPSWAARRASGSLSSAGTGFPNNRGRPSIPRGGPSRRSSSRLQALDSRERGRAGCTGARP